VSHYSDTFARYMDRSPKIPVYQVSSEHTSAIHRFYDTSPISPSGALIAFTEFDFEDRLPVPGDAASVVVRDLRSGAEVYRTRTIAWDTQLGAQAQWGTTDQQLFLNRMNVGEWRPYAVMVDPFSAAETELDGPIYMASPDGRTLLSPNLRSIGNVQPGYGVIVPPEHRRETRGIPSDDGIFVTDVDSGSSSLALSLQDICESLPEEFDYPRRNSANGGMYGFHVKWSPDGQRIMFILRWKELTRRKSLNWIVTMDSDFSNLRVALTPDRWEGGHHPNWCPDSSTIVMNLLSSSRKVAFQRGARFLDRAARKLKLGWYRPAYALRFMTFGSDGSNLGPLSATHTGSGHPSVHSSGKLLLSDAYPWEPVAEGDGTSPIRLLRLDTDVLDEIVQIDTRPPYPGPRLEWRVDPHPAWNYQFDAIAFNGLSQGKRAVFVADMEKVVDQIEP